MKKFFLSFILLLLYTAVLAAESILDFDVTISVDENSTATVTEEITVNAEHNKIKRGIYRNIPQDFMRKIQVKSLEMDYKPHPFFTGNRGKDVVINFGNDDYLQTYLHNEQCRKFRKIL